MSAESPWQIPVSAPYLDLAFGTVQSATSGWGDIVDLQRHSLGKLRLPSGILVASDPLIMFPSTPFSEKFPCGEYDVYVVRAVYEGGDEVNAFATIDFGHLEGEPISWSMLHGERDSVAQLQFGQIFGYPVDAGTGSFYDHTVSQYLKRPETKGTFDWLFRKKPLDITEKNLSTYDEFSERMLALMDQDDWFDLNPDKEDTGPNVIGFSSGSGDGRYASYLGRGQDGEPKIVVTDFAILRDPEPPRDPAVSSPSEIRK